MDKKAKINRINKNDNKCFHYAATVTLNYKEIQKKLQIVSKIQSFISKYNHEEINYQG